MIAGGLVTYIGIVIEDKKEDSDVIVVAPIEFVSDVDGDFGKKENFEVTTRNSRGGYEVSSVEHTNTIYATWIPDGHTNRTTSPDVIKGETVKIIAYRDSDEYYWTTMFNEPQIRRTERVRYSYSNLSTGARIDAYDDDSSYWVEIDTKDKHIRLHTSDNDGESCTYDLTFNTGEGTITLEDNRYNSIHLNSVEGILTATIENEIISKTKVTNHYVSEFTSYDCPKIHLGEPADLEPSVLGDKMAIAMEELIRQINESQVIGNLGVPTSAIGAVKMVDVPNLIMGGNVYSKKNKNQ